MNRKIVICVLLAFVTMIVYSKAINLDFVNFDDPQVITSNLYVATGITAENVVWAFTKSNQGNWNPLSSISHMLDCQLFGMNPQGHHLTSVVIHVVNTILLFIVLNSMTGAVWRSGLVAAIFALHPLHVESVAWISERKDVLSTLFFLAAIQSYLNYLRKSNLQNYLILVLFFVCGTLSKPMIVIFPLMLFIIDYWLKRLPSSNTAPMQNERPFMGVINYHVSFSRHMHWIDKIPLIIISLIICIITLVTQRESIVIGNTFPLPLRVENAFISYVEYLLKTFWPVGLTAYYPYPSDISIWKVFGAVLILSLISLYVLKSKNSPHLAFGWSWYLISLVPVIGIVQVGGQAFADRYTYIPLIGILVMFVWQLEKFSKRRTSMIYVCIGGSTAVIIVLSMLTCTQIGYWQNSIELYSHMISVTRNNALAHLNLGIALKHKWKNDEAIAHFIEALRINPDYELAHFNLGVSLYSYGRYEESMFHFNEVLRLNPDNSYASSYLESVLRKNSQQKH